MITRLLRAAALSWAVAAATMPGLLAVAEAVWIPPSAAGALAHVESRGGSESCPAVHDAHCGVCTMLRHGYVGASGPARAHVPAGVRARPVGTRAFAVDARVETSGIPRAPPAA